MKSCIAYHFELVYTRGTSGAREKRMKSSLAWNNKLARQIAEVVETA